MKKMKFVRNVMVGALLAAYGGVAAAQAVDEVEPNSQISAAQLLTVDANGTVTVNAFFATGDVDFFSFEGKAGDKVTVKVEGGGPTIDTIMTLLGPNDFGPQQALTSNDDCVPGAVIDPCISSFELKSDGIYYAAVTAFPTLVADNGALLSYMSNNPPVGGNYTLSVSGVSPKEVEVPPTPEVPAVKQVRIDVRPGERAERATVHLSRSKIAVAILSSQDFDAMQIDTSTLTFGHTGDEQSLMKCLPKGVDVNRDRRRDLVCLFSIKEADFEPNDLAGFLKGSTTAGTRFEGQGVLKVVEIKKGKRHRHFGGRHDRRDDDRRKHRR